jgi:hypothetical protein
MVQVSIRPNTINKLNEDVLREWNPDTIFTLVGEQWSLKGKVIVDQEMLEECGDRA